MTKKLITLFIFCLWSMTSFAQLDATTSKKLDQYLEENTKVTHKEIVGEAISKILKHKVYFISMRIQGMYNITGFNTSEFIVIEIGDKVKRFEWENTNTDMPEFLCYIKDDFVLNEKTAQMFQDLLDKIYPVEDWKSQHKEFLQKDGKWYFLRDKFFDKKQGFEITVDDNGKITFIKYILKFEIDQ
ncbi:hypothetical protein KMW28_03575 [Flammeovirga yaeyamensis]|uniref:Uncharacterized protein n=1 Tax=Flammeovirga yaeyamensis TaxID=367791 RepID=A0AAX1N519_9BACT|nr:hypothetical protein [Flammeovirga yaeyamensis]MBB3701273.1 hypothetical protein [Flammeovirga yaeyamensis]NMF38257.1 hypothetical protein [Flammeovirga yaeyamensis]QWG02668.1 hypothetical protein KMW28_03575 [Flammeovirga yaeyamensis]